MKLNDMSQHRQEELMNTLFGIFVQLRDYFYVEETGNEGEQGLKIRKEVLKMSVKDVEDLLDPANKDNIIPFRRD